MPIITSIPFWTVTREKSEVRWLFSFPKGLFPVGVIFSKEFRRGELGRESFRFPLDSRFFSGSCFIPHLPPREH